MSVAKSLSFDYLYSKREIQETCQIFMFIHTAADYLQSEDASLPYVYLALSNLRLELSEPLVS